MSRNFQKDLAGARFGRLTVLAFVAREGTRAAYWKCRCECGREVIVYRGNLTHGRQQSCGCLRRELRSATNRGEA